MIPAASLDHVVGAQAATTVIPFSTEISDIAGKNDDIVVRISYPAFSVVGSGVHIRSFDDRRAKGARLLYRSVKPAQLEPEQNAKTAGRCGGVAKVRMAMNVPGVKLENYFAIFHNLLVFIPAVTALATKQLLVPTAAALHISHGDQRLSFHTVTLLPTAPGIKLTPTSA
jgi:hypothetical protein